LLDLGFLATPNPKARSESDDEDDEFPKLKKPLRFLLWTFLFFFSRFSGAAKKPPKIPLA
jgi:hypothetical protein